MWLRDFLPNSTAFQKSRIMTFGYDSALTNRKNNSRIQDWADELLFEVGFVRKLEKVGNDWVERFELVGSDWDG
jgi:hypothetical protein